MNRDMIKVIFISKYFLNQSVGWP